jgi:hypothetical protein
VLPRPPKPPKPGPREAPPEQVLEPLAQKEGGAKAIRKLMKTKEMLDKARRGEELPPQKRKVPLALQKDIDKLLWKPRDWSKFEYFGPCRGAAKEEQRKWYAEWAEEIDPETPVHAPDLVRRDADGCVIFDQSDSEESEGG